MIFNHWGQSKVALSPMIKMDKSMQKSKLGWGEDYAAAAKTATFSISAANSCAALQL